MAPSPLASVVENTMRQSCKVYRYAGADDFGQPVYHDGVTVPCRLAIRTARVLSPDGDYITNTQVTVLVPADTEIQAQDRIDLPAPYDRGAVVSLVTTATDFLGRVTHRAVRIA